MLGYDLLNVFSVFYDYYCGNTKYLDDKYIPLLKDDLHSLACLCGSVDHGKINIPERTKCRHSYCNKKSVFDCDQHEYLALEYGEDLSQMQFYEFGREYLLSGIVTLSIDVSIIYGIQCAFSYENCKLELFDGYLSCTKLGTFFCRVKGTEWIIRLSPETIVSTIQDPRSFIERNYFKKVYGWFRIMDGNMPLIFQTDTQQEAEKWVYSILLSCNGYLRDMKEVMKRVGDYFETNTWKIQN